MSAAVLNLLAAFGAGLGLGVLVALCWAASVPPRRLPPSMY